MDRPCEVSGLSSLLDDLAYPVLMGFEDFLTLRAVWIGLPQSLYSFQGFQPQGL
jgi:hypothetical protein